MKWALGILTPLIAFPIVFMLFIASPQQAVNQCAVSSVGQWPSYTVDGDQYAYAESLVAAAPRDLTPAEAGVVFTMAAHVSDLSLKSGIDPLTGTPGDDDPATSIAAVLDRLRVMDGWDMQPPATTAGLLLEVDPATLAFAWDEAYGLLYYLDPETAALLDAVTRTGSACGTAYVPDVDPGDVVLVGGLTNPLPGSTLTSGFGYRTNPVTGVYKLHAGVDLAYGAGQTCNRPILAAGTGTVSYAGASPGYGHVIMINQADGSQTRYAHMYGYGVLTYTGDQVAAGEVIGLVGSDGNSTGCHLHFETYLANGKVINPVTVMPWLGAA